MKININDIELFYEKIGSGQPLILLHGNGEDHHIFDKLSKQLENHFTIYALDSRNHGSSTMTGEYRYDVMADDLAGFIRAMKLNEPDILGFSDGAIVTLMLALKDPKAVGKMLLPGVNLSPRDFTEECYRMTAEEYQKTKDPLIKLMLEQPEIPLADTGSLENPVLVIAGEDDIFKPESFARLVQTLPNACLKIMTGHNHSSYIVNSAILYPEITGFLL